MVQELLALRALGEEGFEALSEGSALGIVRMLWL